MDDGRCMVLSDNIFRDILFNSIRASLAACPAATGMSFTATAAEEAFLGSAAAVNQGNEWYVID